MGWDGSGNFARTNGVNDGTEVWQDDEAEGTNILSTLHDAHDQDLANGINNCLAKDGQNSATADIDMGGFGLINVSDINGGAVGQRYESMSAFVLSTVNALEAQVASFRGGWGATVLGPLGASKWHYDGTTGGTPTANNTAAIQTAMAAGRVITADGRGWRLGEQVFHPYMFGGLGDGSDDSAAFGAMISRATLSPGARIFVPPSSLYYSIENVELASNITFYGGGEIRARGATYPAFIASAGGAALSNIRFEDIVFKRTDGDGSYGFIIETFVPGAGRHSGITFDGTEFDGSGVKMAVFDDVKIVDCYGHDSWYSTQSTADNIAQTFEVGQVFYIGTALGSGLIFERNRFKTVNGALYADLVSNVSFCDNDVDGTSASAALIRFTINKISNIKATDNKFRNVGRSALVVQRNNVPVDANRVAYRINVSDNTVDGYGVYDNGTHPAIHVQSQGAELCRLLKVTGNVVDGNRTDFPLLNTFQGNGISVSINADVVNLTGNEVYEVQGYGIELAAQTGRLLKQAIVAHNIVAGAISVNGGARNACISISGADFVQLLDNNVKNPGSATITNASGIYINSSQKVIAKRNLCLDDRGTPYMQYGINCSGVVDFIMADDNYAQGYTGVRPFNFGTTSAADYGRNFWYDGAAFNGGQLEVAFSANDATPSVLGGSDFVTANALARTITNFDDGFDGQFIRVRINDANTTLDFTGASLAGNNGSDYACASGDMIIAHRRGSIWYCAIVQG
jgi:hypothetical protein